MGAFAFACVSLLLASLLRGTSGAFQTFELVCIAAMTLSLGASARSIRRYSRLVLVIRVADTVDCEISGKRIELLPYLIRVGPYQCLRFRHISTTGNGIEIASKGHHLGVPLGMVIGKGSATPDGLRRLNRWLEWRASLIDD